MNVDSEQQFRDERALWRPHTITSGMLLASVAVPSAILRGNVDSLLVAPRGLLAAAGLVTALLLVAGLTITRRPKLGQFGASLAVLGTFGLGFSHLAEAPLTTLAALIAGTTGLALLWNVGSPLISPRAASRRLHEGQALGAAIMALTLWRPSKSYLLWGRWVFPSAERLHSTG